MPSYIHLYMLLQSSFEHLTNIPQISKNHLTKNLVILWSLYCHITRVLFSYYNNLLSISQSSHKYFTFNHFNVILQLSYEYLPIIFWSSHNQQTVLQSSCNHIAIILMCINLMSSSSQHIIIFQSSFYHLTIILQMSYNHLTIIS